MKIKSLAVLSVLALAFVIAACAYKQGLFNQTSNHEDDYDFDGVTLSRTQVKDSWLTSLSEKNPRLYVEVAKAMIMSRKMNRPVYIQKDSTNNVTYYYASLESGGGKDVIVADFPIKESRFDHYNDSDGPAMIDSAQQLWIDRKVQLINKEIRASDYK